MARLALCIGINNYPGTHMDLEGCVNDAHDWAALLTSRGFSVDTLIDAQATKAGMVAGFKRVIGDAVDGDVVVITFSGHGTYAFDSDGDEDDSLDEALCPCDVQTNDAALTDDEIHALLKARKEGVSLVMISDSCHSGTVSRAITRNDSAPRPRFMPPAHWMSEQRLRRQAMTRTARSARAHVGRSAFVGDGDFDAGELLLAGCEEGENHFSYDANIAGRANGAFTYYALKTLETLPADATYADWHAGITPNCLPTPLYAQRPQIVGNATARSRKIFS